MLELIEYIKIHLISLEQDLEGISEEMELLNESMESKEYVELDYEYNHKSGQILSTRHLLSVAEGILSK